MTGRPAAFSALALASTASVADSEMAATRAETLVGMRSIVAPGGGCPAAIFPAGPDNGRAGRCPRGLAVRRGGLLDVHCLDRQPSCRLRQHARVRFVSAVKQYCARQQVVLDGSAARL